MSRGLKYNLSASLVYRLLLAPDARLEDSRNSRDVVSMLPLCKFLSFFLCVCVRYSLCLFFAYILPYSKNNPYLYKLHDLSIWLLAISMIFYVRFLVLSYPL